MPPATLLSTRDLATIFHRSDDAITSAMPSTLPLSVRQQILALVLGAVEGGQP